MRKRISPALVAFFLLATGCSGQSFSYESTFDQVWQTVNDRFYDPNFGGVDWSDVGTRFRPRVVGAENDSVFYVTLNEMLFELGVSHIGVIPPDHPEWIGAPAVFADGDVGADVRILEDQIVITSVEPGSPAEAADLHRGQVIQRIDGLTLAEMRAQALTPPVPAIDARIIVNEHVQGRLYGPTGKAVIVEVGSGDEARSVTLVRQPRPGRTEFMEGIPPVYLEFESRRISGRFGYIRFNSFHRELLDDILAAIDEMREADGIVLDLRGNPGGDFQVRRALVAKLVMEPVPFWTYRGRDGDDVIRVDPHPRPYTGAVAVIVDRASASSSEELAGGLQAIGRAAVIGERTPGSVLVADVVQLDNGATLVYPSAETRVADGTVLEGRGVIPDVPVQLDAGSLADGRDVQLEAALTYLREAARGSGSSSLENHRLEAGRLGYLP